MAVANAPNIRIAGAKCEITFDRLDLDAYKLFIQCKRLPESTTEYDWERDIYTVTTAARFGRLLGIDVGPLAYDELPIAEHLFDYQRWVLEMALDAKRFAVWLDTGLGKTSIILEFARHALARTGARVLILSPLAVIPQTMAEAVRFYGDALPIERLRTRDDLQTFCAGDGAALGICNYDKMIDGVLPEMRYLGGLILDESGILKTGGGVIKWNLIKSSKGVEYKLSCTATPAPNDTMEYASQASFLEKLQTEGDIIWTYFTRNKAGDWVVKPHAREAFYRFMASWSVYLRNPAHFGFRDILASLPDPEIHEYKLDLTEQQRFLMYGVLVVKGGMFSDDRMGVQERTRLAQFARGFFYETIDGKRMAQTVASVKPAFVADLVTQEIAAGRPTLVWTVFDEEGSIIAGLLRERNVPYAILDGSMSEDRRIEIIGEFKSGAVPVLISKASLLGAGLNFQHCRAMVFSGIDDSFERMYQAIRRAYRFGQTETVHVHVPYIPELEGMMFTNTKRKEQRFNEDVGTQEGYYREVLRGSL